MSVVSRRGAVCLWRERTLFENGELINHRAAFDIARSRDADDDDDADGADGASSRLVVVVVVDDVVVVYDDDDDDDETRTMDARVRTRSLERSRRGNTAAETSRGRDGDAGET